VTDFEATQQAKENTLETLATLYPLALAMAAKSNSCSGRALQQMKLAEVIPLPPLASQTPPAPPP